MSLLDLFEAWPQIYCSHTNCGISERRRKKSEKTNAESVGMCRFGDMTGLPARGQKTLGANVTPDRHQGGLDDLINPSTLCPATICSLTLRNIKKTKEHLLKNVTSSFSSTAKQFINTWGKKLNLLKCADRKRKKSTNNSISHHS